MTKDREFIRSVHPYGFRSGQWAEILKTVPLEDGRPSYHIRFADGTEDWWVVNDPSDEREFTADSAVM